MSGVDEATKIVHSSQPTSHRGDDPGVVHPPLGGTGYQTGPARENPLGDGGVSIDNSVVHPPLGDTSGSFGPDENRNPLGGKAPFDRGVQVPPLGGKAPFSRGVVETNPKRG